MAFVSVERFRRTIVTPGGRTPRRSGITALMDSRRWRRDSLLQRIAAIQSYFGDACEAMDDQHRLTHQKVDEVRGEGRPVPDERIERTNGRWNSRHGSRIRRQGAGSTPSSSQAADSLRRALRSNVVVPPKIPTRCNFD